MDNQYILLLVKSQYLLSKFYLQLLSNLNTYDKFIVTIAEEQECIVAELHCDLPKVNDHYGVLKS